ncbi:Periplasmic binding protein-like domain protein [compost metagenome]
MGFGDYEVASELNPGLTTIAAPTVRMGEEAARILVRRLRNETPDTRTLDLGFELVARGSA